MKWKNGRGWSEEAWVMRVKKMKLKIDFSRLWFWLWFFFQVAKILTLDIFKIWAAQCRCGFAHLDYRCIWASPIWTKYFLNRFGRVHISPNWFTNGLPMDSLPIWHSYQEGTYVRANSNSGELNYYHNIFCRIYFQYMLNDYYLCDCEGLLIVMSLQACTQEQNSWNILKH